MIDEPLGGVAMRLRHRDVVYVGTIPLDPRLREQGDLAEPIVAADPEAESSRAIRAIADAVAATRREQGVGIVKSLPVLS